MKVKNDHHIITGKKRPDKIKDAQIFLRLLLSNCLSWKIYCQREMMSSYHFSSSLTSVSSQLTTDTHLPMISVCSRSTVFDESRLKPVSWLIPVWLLNLTSPCMLVGIEVTHCWYSIEGLWVVAHLGIHDQDENHTEKQYEKKTCLIKISYKLQHFSWHVIQAFSITVYVTGKVRL